MPEAIRCLIDPTNPNRRLIQWSNNRLSAAGTDPPPQPEIVDFDEWSPGQVPVGPDGVSAGFMVTDWSVPSGYTWSVFAHFFPFGDAPDIPTIQQPIQNDPIVVDAMMNPAGDGQGYAVLVEGSLLVVGGAAGIQSVSVGSPIIRRAYMKDWVSRQYVMLDHFGGFHARHLAPQVSVQGRPPGDHLWQEDASGGAVFHDYAAGGWKGWLNHQQGVTLWLNDAEDPAGYPLESVRAFTDIAIINDGTGADPLRLTLLSRPGFFHEWTAAVAPVLDLVTPGLPVDPTTNTTMPSIGWVYGNDRGDGQDEVQLRVFTDAQYGAVGFDPETSEATWLRNLGPGARNDRTAQIDVDLENDTYRVYVRVKSTAGLWSAWEFREWVQNVVKPAAPVLVLTDGGDLFGMSLTVTEAAPLADSVLGVQYRDNPGFPWQWVLGGALENAFEAPDGLGQGTIIDRSRKVRVEREYRAVQLVRDPILVGEYTAVQASTLTTDEWTLIDPEGVLGLYVDVIPPFKFSEKVVALVAYPAGRRRAVVQSDGPPKGMETKLGLWSLDMGTYNALRTLYLSAQVMLLRDPHQRSWHCAISHTVDWEMLRARAMASEDTKVRHAHTVELPVVEVDPPLAGPLEGPLALAQVG